MYHKASGNILFIILIAVALFAALSYAITSNTRTSEGNTSKEQARTDAAAILQYGTAVRSAVQRLKLVGGCTDYTLDFSNTVFKRTNNLAVTPPNSNAPADKSCNVFDPKGGNAIGIILNASSVDPTFAFPATKIGHSRFMIVQVRGVGTDGPGGTEAANDLILSTEYLNKQTCMAINDLVGVANPSNSPPVYSWIGTAVEFGSADFAGSTAITSNPSPAVSAPVFCRWTGSNYAFQYTLLER